MFLVGRLEEKDDFLLSALQRGLSKTEMSMKDYFGNSLRTAFYYRHARSYARRGIYSMNEPSATVRGVNRPIPPNYKFHAIDATSDLDQVRPLTTSERAQVQTFPKSFRWPLHSRTALEQLIGERRSCESGQVRWCHDPHLFVHARPTSSQGDREA